MDSLVWTPIVQALVNLLVAIIVGLTPIITAQVLTVGKRLEAKLEAHKDFRYFLERAMQAAEIMGIKGSIETVAASKLQYVMDVARERAKELGLKLSENQIRAEIEAGIARGIQAVSLPALQPPITIEVITPEQQKEIDKTAAFVPVEETKPPGEVISFVPSPAPVPAPLPIDEDGTAKG